MREYYKVAANGYIEGFGTNGPDNVPAITEAEYNNLAEMFASRPSAPEGYAYLLRDDPREWVLVEMPPEDPEMDDSEAFEFLFGGAE